LYSVHVLQKKIFCGNRRFQKVVEDKVATYYALLLFVSLGTTRDVSGSIDSFFDSKDWLHCGLELDYE